MDPMPPHATADHSHAMFSQVMSDEGSRCLVAWGQSSASGPRPAPDTALACCPCALPRTTIFIGKRMGPRGLPPFPFSGLSRYNVKPLEDRNLWAGVGPRARASMDTLGQGQQWWLHRLRARGWTCWKLGGIRGPIVDKWALRWASGVACGY